MSFAFNWHQLRASSVIWQVAFGAVIVLVAYGLRTMLDHWLGTRYVFGLFYLAVSLAAAFGLLWGGLTATALSGFATATLIGLDYRHYSEMIEWSIFLAGALVITLLFDARDKAMQRADEAQAILTSLIEALPMGVALFDREMRYAMVNPTLAQINGISAHAHIGKSVAELLPDIATQIKEPFERALRAPAQGLFVEVSGETPATRGEHRIWRECWFPVRVLKRSPTYVGAIVEDVTGQRRTERELANANRRKEDTLAFIAHELRNPLGAIINAHAVLVHTSEQGESRPLSIIGRQVRAIQRVLDDLLDVARLNTGRVQLVLAPVDLRKVIQDATETLEPIAQDKRQHIVLQMPDQEVVCRVDASRLHQVLVNLGANACKFSPAKSTVAMTLREEQDCVCISVRDSGQGIAAEDLGRIFEKWEQAEAENPSGLGLGLALAEGIIRLHGGHINVVSEGLGKGAEFTVILPNTLIARSD